MIFFGHVGITTAVVKSYENFVTHKKNNKYTPTIDYRLVMIGSLLPDIIDKPIGAYFFRNTFHNSRIFCHSLLFSIGLMILGSYYFYRRKNNNVFLLGVCSFIHQILDSMWLYPGIFYWPIYGWKFPTRPEGHWVANDIVRLLTDPYVYMPEIVGAIIIAYYFTKLVAKGKFREFIRYGRL